MPHLRTLVLCLLAALVMPAAAMAHPHVWVTSKADIVVEGGKVIAIDHHWTFDEFYTAMAIQGLDKNGDGIYSREELAELAQTNMDGLKEFEYFTLAKAGGKKLAFGTPSDAWLEHTNGILTLHFRLPLKEPVATTPKFEVAVFDSSAFIAFELAKDDAVKLAGSPGGCSVSIGDMEDKPEEKALAGAFAQTLGTAGGFMGGAIKAAVVTCSNS